MRTRSGRSADSGIWDTLKLEWEVGLRRLPFFTQRLAVALLGLLLVSLALVGAMAILWGRPQSDLPLRPPSEAHHPTEPNGASGVEPPHQPHVGGDAEMPTSARSSNSSSTISTVAPRRAHTPSTATPSSTTTTTPPTTSDDPPSPLTVPPVLNTLLR